MASPKIKLTYFNIRGLAEPIRLVFHVANLDFEDHRIEFTEWETLKPTIPGGRLPILEITDGETTKVYTESMAIARMFARKHHMMGSTDEEYYEIERVLGQCADINRELYAAHKASDEEKVKMTSVFREESGLRLLTLISEHLKSSPSGLVAGSTLSLADLAILCSTDQVKVFVPGFIEEKFPGFQEHRDLVLKQCPKLAEYLSTRGSHPV